MSSTAFKSSIRTRAFSVGSKVKNRLNETGKIEMKDKKMRKPQTDKSTSVPALIKQPKSGASDHVEIDFRSHTGSFNRKVFGLSPSNTNTSEYMEMHPSNNNTEKEMTKKEKSDYVEMGVNLPKSERCSSKPIEIIKKKNDKFQSHDVLTSSLLMDDISENDGQNIMFPLSLENCSTWDMKLPEKITTKLDQITSDDTEHLEQHQTEENEIKDTSDDGDYAILLPGDGFENKKDDGQVSCKQNYVDLYFPQQIKENNSNPKKEEIITKSTYAQIVFPDIQPK